VPKTTTRASAKKTTTAKPKGATKPAAAKPDAAAQAASAKAAEEKRQAREAQTASQQAAVVKRVVNGDEKLAVVAKDLNITSGKAAFLIMQHRVAEGEVPTITGKDDDALLKNIAAARAKGDEFSSWGWLAARSGKSEGFIKSGLEKAGSYKPGAENIATKRAASKPAAAKKTASAKKTGSAKVRGNA